MFRAKIRHLLAFGLGTTTTIMAGCGSEWTPGPEIVALAAVSGLGQSGYTGTVVPNPFVVRAADQSGTAAEGLTVTWRVVSGGGSVSPSQSVTDADGLASTTLRLGATAGAQTVEAVLGRGQPVQFTVTARAVGAPARLLVVSGADQSAAPGATLADSLVVRLIDDFNNPVSNVEVVWTPVGSLAGRVSPTKVKTDADGRAAAAWILGETGGPKQVEATVGSLDPAVFVAAGTVVYSGVFAGSRHTCANDVGGVSYCWGFNDDGQLGIGEEAGGAGPVFSAPKPLASTGALTFGAISAGRHHSCAITLSNIGYCWGASPDGRTGTTSQTNAPAQVPAPSVFSSTSAGRTHTCGLTLMGVVDCWGSNQGGQLGDSARTTTRKTVDIWDPAIAIAAGGLHSCAVTLYGDAYCWGFNRYGQAGNSMVEEIAPVGLVSGGLAFMAITAGENHTCALSTTGSAYCWGDNTFGQLGDGSTVPSADPIPVESGLTFVSLSAGYAHTCGITSSDVAYCWGRNLFGELGDGTTQNRSAPVAVGGGLSFTMITAGGGDAGISPAIPPAHTCGLTTGKVIYCWGDNQFGALGDGTLTNRRLPAKVAFQP